MGSLRVLYVRIGHEGATCSTIKEPPPSGKRKGFTCCGAALNPSTIASVVLLQRVGSPLARLFSLLCGRHICVTNGDRRCIKRLSVLASTVGCFPTHKPSGACEGEASTKGSLPMVVSVCIFVHGTTVTWPLRATEFFNVCLSGLEG